MILCDINKKTIFIDQRDVLYLIPNIHNPQPALSGVVVLYNPDCSVLANIYSYLEVLDKVYVVDNSDKPDNELQCILKRDTRISYHFFGCNLGVARALNFGAQLALDGKSDWLLTMDQDSRFVGDNLPRMLQSIEKVDYGTVGMVCSRYSPKNRYVIGVGDRFNDLLVGITSGSFLNLDLYHKTGPFMEELFIDQVDHEYCLRLRSKGYRIVQIKDVFVDHQLGNSKNHLFFRSSHHNPIRRYYMSRNRFYVANMYKELYPRFYWTEMVRATIELMKIILMEDEKKRKIKAIYLGFLDYRSGRFDRDVKTL